MAFPQKSITKTVKSPPRCTVTNTDVYLLKNWYLQFQCRRHREDSVSDRASGAIWQKGVWEWNSNAVGVAKIFVGRCRHTKEVWRRSDKFIARSRLGNKNDRKSYELNELFKVDLRNLCEKKIIAPSRNLIAPKRNLIAPKSNLIAPGLTFPSRWDFVLTQRK